jgi:hypothetical protein
MLVEIVQDTSPAEMLTYTANAVDLFNAAMARRRIQSNLRLESFPVAADVEPHYVLVDTGILHHNGDPCILVGPATLRETYVAANAILDATHTYLSILDPRFGAPWPRPANPQETVDC